MLAAALALAAAGCSSSSSTNSNTSPAGATSATASTATVDTSQCGSKPGVKATGTPIALGAGSGRPTSCAAAGP